MNILNKQQIFFLLVFILLKSNWASADIKHSRIYKHPKSKCKVHSTAGHYPIFTVYCGSKILYAPKSDGIQQVVFSPSGEYIAFVGSEICGVDIKSNIYDYSVVVLNCNTGKLKGFFHGIPNSGFKWITNTKFLYSVNQKGKQKKIVIEF